MTIRLSGKVRRNVWQECRRTAALQANEGGHPTIADLIIYTDDRWQAEAADGSLANLFDLWLHPYHRPVTLDHTSDDVVEVRLYPSGRRLKEMQRLRRIRTSDEAATVLANADQWGQSQRHRLLADYGEPDEQTVRMVERAVA